MARKDFSEAELKKGAKYYKYNSYDAATRKIKDRIGKQLERHEWKWTNPDAKFRSGDEAPWRRSRQVPWPRYRRGYRGPPLPAHGAGRHS